jgi:hypothetical protein
LADLAEPDEAVVCGAVAVVVASIADLDAGLDALRATDDRVSIRTALRHANAVAVTDADLARDADARIALVCGAVAVVIDAVATLDPGGDALRGADGRPTVRPAHADARAAAGAHADLTSAVQVRVGLVHGAVAVVVEAVALLSARGACTRAALHGNAVVATHRNPCARARPAAIRTANVEALEALVRVAVAVVVDRVAELVCRLARPSIARRAQLVGAAPDDADGEAGALAHRAGPEQVRVAFVRGPVAVVV